MKKIIMALLMVFVGGLGILTGIFGIPEGYPFLSSFFPFLFLLPCMIQIYREFGWKNGTILLIILSIYSLLIETIGLSTGFPYGTFTYGSQFTYKLFSITPIIVPFVWVPLCIGAYEISIKNTKNIVKSYINFSLLLIGADFVIDPAAVSLHLWRYITPGIYYAIPFSNFLGWAITGTGAFLIIKYFLNKRTIQTTIGYHYFFLLLFWTCVCGIKGLFLPLFIGSTFLLYILYRSKPSF